MTELAEPPAPRIDFLKVRRLRDGEEVRTELMVQLEPAYAMVPPVLTIASGWVDDAQGGRGYAHWDTYRVREAPGYGGRTFRLGREERKLLTLPPGADRRPEYEVVVTPGGGWCSCRGYEFSELHSCKHLDALGHFARAGALDNLSAETSDEQGHSAGGGGEAEPGGAGEDRQGD